MDDRMIFGSHFRYMMDVTELTAVIYQGMGGNNIQNLLEFQVIIVPDSFPGEGFVIITSPFQAEDCIYNHFICITLS